MLQVTIRLGRNAQRFAAVPLAASKSLAIAVIAVAWLPCTALFETVTRGEATQLWPGWQNPMAWLAVVWSALGPGALVAYLQSQASHLCCLSVHGMPCWWHMLCSIWELWQLTCNLEYIANAVAADVSLAACCAKPFQQSEISVFAMLAATICHTDMLPS